MHRAATASGTGLEVNCVTAPGVVAGERCSPLRVQWTRAGLLKAAELAGSVMRLTRLADNLVDVARLEGAAFSIEPRLVELVAMLAVPWATTAAAVIPATPAMPIGGHRSTASKAGTRSGAVIRQLGGARMASTK